MSTQHAQIIHAEGACVDLSRCDHKPPREDEIEFCREWIRKYVEPTKTIRRRYGSYAYKHMVENTSRSSGELFNMIDPWGRAWCGDYKYVSNGSYIVAALLEGYRFEACGGTSPNGWFNMKLRNLTPPRIRAAKANQAHGQTAPGKTLLTERAKALEPVDTAAEVAKDAGVSRAPLANPTDIARRIVRLPSNVIPFRRPR